MLPRNIELLPHEIEHYNTLDSLATECTLFFKRDKSFPISKPCKVALFGPGARHTVKGGTGSGDVNSHFFANIEDELELQGFTITSKKWLDAYDEIRLENEKAFVKRVKKEAKQKKLSVPSYSVGQSAPECEYDLPLDEYDGDICLYILSRVSGENSDRKLEKGDIYLTDTEIRDILYLNSKFEKIMLVLNVPGVVDISPILEVSNIFYLSQLGVVTSSTLVNVVLGKTNPSGKLATTWAKPEDYPFFNEFGDKDDTRYKEGIYVGYRYFSSKNVEPLFPFGYGLSYSDFEYEFTDAKYDKGCCKIKVKVDNVSDFAGKEVVQLYLSCKGRIDTPRLILVAFKKTDEIKAHKYQELELEFNLKDFPIFDESRRAYIIQEGTYVIRGGNSSNSLTDIAKFVIEKDIVIKEVEPIFDKPDFEDLVIPSSEALDAIKVKSIKVDESDFLSKNDKITSKFAVKITGFINSLTLDEIILLNLGDYKEGIQGMIGQTGSLVPGGAGETTLRIKSLPHSLSMADGPAGLRLIPEYKVNHKGTYNLVEDSIWKSIKPYLPGIITKLMDVKKNRKKEGSVIYQYCTALPIASALSQSWNSDLLFKIGRLVQEEMKIYDVDIWLAPGMNIHRHILCGRNFEYYSEDPLLSSMCASYVVKGVQTNSDRKCVVKHFACNNQEINRFNSNSIVSERALREIYLLNFEKAIKESEPSAVMTSYNLINGVHTSESLNLLLNVLRNEWGYRGLVMTDWVVTGQINDKSSKHPYIHASKCLSNGVNICMPGSKKDIKDIKRALKRGDISIEQLKENASLVYQYIEGIKIS